MPRGCGHGGRPRGCRPAEGDGRRHGGRAQALPKTRRGRGGTPENHGSESRLTISYHFRPRRTGGCILPLLRHHQGRVRPPAVLNQLLSGSAALSRERWRSSGYDDNLLGCSRSRVPAVIQYAVLVWGTDAAIAWVDDIG